MMGSIAGTATAGVSSAAAEAASGSMSAGNIRMNNVNMNKYDAAQTMNAGTSSKLSMDMQQTASNQSSVRTGTEISNKDIDENVHKGSTWITDSQTGKTYEVNGTFDQTSGGWTGSGTINEYDKNGNFVGSYKGEISGTGNMSDYQKDVVQGGQGGRENAFQASSVVSTNLDASNVKHEDNISTANKIEQNNDIKEAKKVEDTSTTINNSTNISTGTQYKGVAQAAMGKTEDFEKMNEEQEILEEDWLEDTNYDNIENIETESIENVNEEELISEPQDNNMVQEVLAIENSTVISDRTFKTGEIPIDINSVQQPELENAESLESIYNPNAKIPGEGLLQTPGTMGAKQNKSGLGIGLGIAGTLITLALVGAIGFGAAKLFKGPSTETPQPITDDNLPATDTNISEENTLKIDPNNVVNMDENQNALASTTQNATEQKSAAKTTQAPVKKKMAPTSFIEVKKLTWEVPDYISYNTQFKQYFQSIGKSLKLSLGSDLLLATDPIFSNQVRVSVTFEKDGTFKNSQIIVSSGSTQVDKIVLQTVNDTLKAVKAPHSVGNDENTTVILKLYF